MGAQWRTTGRASLDYAALPNVLLARLRRRVDSIAIAAR
jgi:hypothetical protein